MFNITIREMQIKTTMRHPLTTVKMAIINKSTNNICWRVCGEKESLLHCWWECKLVQPLWITVWRFLKKLKVEQAYDPAIPLLGIHPEKTITWKDTCTPMFIAALFTIVKIWKQSKCPLTDDLRTHSLRGRAYGSWGKGGVEGQLGSLGLTCAHCYI